MSADFLVHIILWLLGFVFFFHLPVCKNGRAKHAARSPLSIIVPARNEEENIPNLLTSLKGQLKAEDELLVVDDHSEDKTAVVAEQGGAKVIKSMEMPPGWTGKTWACYQGAQVAKGKVLLFMDADTMVEEGGLDRIVSTYNETDGVLSIQPYHKMRKLYEQLSAFFNLVLMAGMGSFTILGKIMKPIGLFGPVIVLDKKRYIESSGFERVKGEIMEDLAFGSEFKKLGVTLHCFGGRHAVSFRMYPEGISQLINGWSKGFAGRVRLDTLRVDYVTIIRERRKRSGSSLSLPSCSRQVISHAGGIVENPLLRDLHGNIEKNPDMMMTDP